MAETGLELHVRNSVWTAPARADRMLAVLQKSRSWTTFLKDFGVLLGAKSSHLGHFGLTMALSSSGFGLAGTESGNGRKATAIQDSAKPKSI